MRVVTKKWLFLKISSAILIPLMIWFIINFASFYDKNYNEIVRFLSTFFSDSCILGSFMLTFWYSFTAVQLLMAIMRQPNKIVCLVISFLFRYVLIYECRLDHR